MMQSTLPRLFSGAFLLLHCPATAGLHRATVPSLGLPVWFSLGLVVLCFALGLRPAAAYLVLTALVARVCGTHR